MQRISDRQGSTFKSNHAFASKYLHVVTHYTKCLTKCTFMNRARKRFAFITHLLYLPEAVQEPQVHACATICIALEACMPVNNCVVTGVFYFAACFVVWFGQLQAKKLQQACSGVSDMFDTGVPAQILLEDPSFGFRPEWGDEIVPLVAGTDSDKSTGLTYYFTQQELKQLLEFERLTQLQIEKLRQGQFSQ